MNIVLVNPQIPPNTGNIARLCAGFKMPLHLVHPLGFSTEDRYLKRAGLDYWPHVELYHYDSIHSFFNSFPNGNFYYLTTKSKRAYTSIKFQEGDFLLFGSETKGLPEELLNKDPQRTLTVPMSGPIRSFNLSSTVAVVAGEALRQLGRV